MRATLAAAAAAALALAGCGSGSVSTVTEPPTLTVTKNAETVSGTAIRPCRHYYYVIDADGRRHRMPCSAKPTPPEPDNPHPTPTPPTPYHPASGCGIERWAVKTLTDPSANQVNLTSIVNSDIATLTSIAAPVNPTDRLAPVETTVYRIKGTLTVAKQEADHDFHLVIVDNAGLALLHRGATYKDPRLAGHMLIVEIPDPACATDSVVSTQLAQVRQQFVAKYGTPGSHPNPDLKPNAPVTVTGVGFFDRIHGQTGVAPNGIELHPVLSIAYP